MREREEFIARPILSLQTMLRMVALGNARLVPVIPDGIFGTNTTAAVTAFQRHYRLPVTGVVDHDTWMRLVREYNGALVTYGPAEPLELLFAPRQILAAGERNDHVYLVQALLTVLSEKNLGLPAPGLTGAMDPETVRSVKAFQHRADLPENGEVDRKTWQHLSKFYTAATGDGCARREK